MLYSVPLSLLSASFRLPLCIASLIFLYVALLAVPITLKRSTLFDGWSSYEGRVVPLLTLPFTLTSCHFVLFCVWRLVFAFLLRKLLSVACLVLHGVNGMRGRMRALVL